MFAAAGTHEELLDHGGLYAALWRVQTGEATPMDLDIMASVQEQIIGHCLCVLGDAMAISSEKDADLLALDEALKTLATLDERKARIVELRFFGGLSVEETAEVLGISDATVMREWKKAKAWLYQTIVQD